MRHRTRADLDALAEIFTAGFVDDPWFRWLWPADNDYAAQPRESFTLLSDGLPEGPLVHRSRYGSQGRGESLMRRTLETCDTDGFGAHLVSTNERNLSFSRRLGFELTGELPVVGGAVAFPAEVAGVVNTRLTRRLRQRMVDE